MLDAVTVLGVTAALLAALCVGYLVGRRAGARTPTWRQRTSAAALGRQAATLVALVAARRLERAVRRLPGAVKPVSLPRRLPWPIWR